ncbi:hypothetical protein RF11_10628 [Thelohanellus kitauei]|uniref:Uncharacterized protein n=1 Tax=Thelohanellus kitauei TaxID=669202 RepID=A0A0C2IUK3_THEKT|nr:hypothetical protein RF11_10628 [Thelohanellus kitauei]
MFQNGDCGEKNPKVIFDYINQVSNLKQKIDAEVQTLLEKKREDEKQIQLLKSDINQKCIQLKEETKKFQELNVSFQKLLFQYTQKCEKYKNLKNHTKQFNSSMESVRNVMDNLKENQSESKTINYLMEKKLGLHLEEFGRHLQMLNEISHDYSIFKRNHLQCVKKNRQKIKYYQRKLEKTRKEHLQVSIQALNSSSLAEELSNSFYTLMCNHQNLQTEKEYLVSELNYSQRRNIIQNSKAQKLVECNLRLRHVIRRQEVQSFHQINDFRGLLFCFISTNHKQLEKIRYLSQCSRNKTDIIARKDLLINKCFDRIKTYKNYIYTTYFLMEELQNYIERFNKFYVSLIIQEKVAHEKDCVIKEFVDNVRKASLDFDTMKENQFTNLVNLWIHCSIKNKFNKSHISEVENFITKVLKNLSDTFEKLSSKKLKIKEVESLNSNNQNLIEKLQMDLENEEKKTKDNNLELLQTKEKMEELRSCLKSLELSSNEKMDEKEKQLEISNKKLLDLTREILEFQAQSDENAKKSKDRIILLDQRVLQLEKENSDLKLKLKEQSEKGAPRTKRLLNNNDHLFNINQQISSTPCPGGKKISIPNTPLSIITPKKTTGRRKKANDFDTEDVDVFAFK